MTKRHREGSQGGPAQASSPGLLHTFLPTHISTPCAQLGNGTCLFVGDDEAFIAEAADLAQQQLGCAVFSERAKYELPRHKQSMFNHLPLEERCKATLHLLKDLELLAHSDYFVGAPRC